MSSSSSIYDKGFSEVVEQYPEDSVDDSDLGVEPGEKVVQLIDDRVSSLDVAAGGGVGVLVQTGESSVSLLFFILWIDSSERWCNSGDATLGEVA